MNKLKFFLPAIIFMSCQKENVDKNSDSLSNPPLAGIQQKIPEICVFDQQQLEENFAAKGGKITTPDPLPPPPTNPLPPPPTGGYACIYLDFDGETVTSPRWNGGSTLVCAASGMTSEQKALALRKVTTAYALNNVVITDQLSVYLGSNMFKRTRVIITPTSSWQSNVAGIAYMGSITWGDNTPAFVFSNKLLFDGHYIGEAIAHESGHTTGLRHQSKWTTSCTLAEAYAMGKTMGNSYYVPQGAWVYGTTQIACNNYQDDNQILRNVLGTK